MTVNDFIETLDALKDAYREERFGRIDFERLLVSIMTGQVKGVYRENTGELWLFKADTDIDHMNAVVDLDLWRDKALYEVVDIGKKGYL